MVIVMKRLRRLQLFLKKQCKYEIRKLMNRRDFLSFVAATSVFSNTVFALSKESDQKILILIELQGANDGLNTEIPFKHSKYKNLRPNLFIWLGLT